MRDRGHARRKSAGYSCDDTHATTQGRSRDDDNEVNAVEHERIRWMAGCWDLTECTFTAADGTVMTPWGAAPTGVLLVTPQGDFSAHGGRSDRQPLAGDIATPAEKQAAYDDYFSYYARIVAVDESASTIVNAVDGATDPDWIGSQQVRYLDTEDDDHMVLRTPPLMLAGNKVIGRMAWKRRSGCSG